MIDRAVIPDVVLFSMRNTPEPGCNVATGLEEPPFGVQVTVAVAVVDLLMMTANCVGLTGNATDVGEVPNSVVLEYVDTDPMNWMFTGSTSASALVVLSVTDKFPISEQVIAMSFQ